jgi:hypothetical protein
MSDPPAGTPKDIAFRWNCPVQAAIPANADWVRGGSVAGWQNRSGSEARLMGKNCPCLPLETFRHPSPNHAMAMWRLRSGFLRKARSEALCLSFMDLSAPHGAFLAQKDQANTALLFHEYGPSSRATACHPGQPRRHKLRTFPCYWFSGCAGPADTQPPRRRQVPHPGTGMDACESPDPWPEPR